MEFVPLSTTDINSVGRGRWEPARVLSDSLAVGAAECEVLHVDWQTLFVLSHTQAQPLKCRLDRQSWNICSFPSWCSSRARKGRVSGQASLCQESVGSGSAVTLSAAGEGAGLTGTRPWGFVGGKGACDLHGLNFNTGTKIRNSVREDAGKHGINFLIVY